MPDRRWGDVATVTVIVVVGVALRWGALDAGLHMDDIAQKAMVEGAYPVARSWWDLFDFAGGEPEEIRALASRGYLPWWSDPELRLRALRPLSSALVWFDVKVLRTAWLGHAHSMLWWIALLVAMHRVLRRLLTPRWAAVAVALYALDDCHTFPLAWLANRSAIISTLFAVLAVGSHVRWREGGREASRWASFVLAALSLAAGEYGIAGLAFVLAYELVGAEGPARDRLRALAPVAALAIAYVLIHRVFGYGAASSSVYVDPFADPAGFLVVAAERVPLLVTDMLFATPLATLLGSGYSPVVLGIGAIGAAGVWVALVWKRFEPLHRRRIAWMALAAAGALLPVASSFLSGRLTIVAAVGSHVVVAALLVDAGARVRDAALHKRISTWVATAAALGLAYQHGPVAVNAARGELEAITKLNRVGRLVAEAMPVVDAKAATQRWVLLTAIDPMILIYPPLLRWSAGHPLPKSWLVLSMAAGLHRIERVSPRALEVTVDHGALLQRPVERFFRSPDRALKTGDAIELDDVTIDVIEADADGAIVRVRFTFAQRLEHPSLKFFVFGGGGLLAYPIGRGVMSVAPGADPLLVDEARLRAKSR